MAVQQDGRSVRGVTVTAPQDEPLLLRRLLLAFNDSLCRRPLARNNRHLFLEAAADDARLLLGGSGLPALKLGPPPRRPFLGPRPTFRDPFLLLPLAGGPAFRP